MTPNIRFEAQVAVGIEGVAVMSLTEHWLDGSGDKREDVACEWIRDDIQDWSAYDWICHITGQEMEPGMYKVTGQALTHDDTSTNYLMVITDPQKATN